MSASLLLASTISRFSTGEMHLASKQENLIRWKDLQQKYTYYKVIIGHIYCLIYTKHCYINLQSERIAIHELEILSPEG